MVGVYVMRIDNRKTYLDSAREAKFVEEIK